MQRFILFKYSSQSFQLRCDRASLQTERDFAYKFIFDECKTILAHILIALQLDYNFMFETTLQSLPKLLRT